MTRQRVYRGTFLSQTRLSSWYIGLNWITSNMTRQRVFRGTFLSQTRLSSWYIAPFLGLVLDREHTSFGISTHSSTGLRRGTNLVTCLQILCGSKLQVSFGTSWMTVSFLSKHSSAPGTWVVLGPQTSRGTFLHSVSGLYFLTFPALVLHFWTGHLVHFCSVV